MLGPEMKSTGEVMGLDTSFGRAFAKSQMSVDSSLPLAGRAFSVCGIRINLRRCVWRRNWSLWDFSVLATQGTAAAITAAGVHSGAGQKSP